MDKIILKYVFYFYVNVMNLGVNTVINTNLIKYMKIIVIKIKNRQIYFNVSFVHTIIYPKYSLRYFSK